MRGKKNVTGCTCTHNFTCRSCLETAPPYYYTPDTPGAVRIYSTYGHVAPFPEVPRQVRKS